MNESKAPLINQIISTLQKDLAVLRKAAAETHSDSTSAESKQESKYDTRGLEASYLAEAQAEQVNQLEQAINKLQQLPACELDEDAPAALGAMVIVSTDKEDFQYMILPAGGGMELGYQGLSFTVVTPDSPIGTSLIGKTVGERITLPQQGSAFLSELW